MMSLLEPHQISHGTIECADMTATRRFLKEFLGLDVVVAMKESQYISKGGPWSVVCVNVRTAIKSQEPDNYFEVCVESAEEVTQGHLTAERMRDRYGIRKINPVEQSGDLCWFLLQDSDGNWWKISNFTPQRLDAIFDAADASQR